MADAQLSVLITAVDDMSSTLAKIEKNIESMSKNTEKQTKAVGTAFQETTGSLLVLGQAAQRVDTIFSAYENMQLRIESAQDRVANATDRLEEAQYQLRKTMIDSTSTADDISQAQRRVETATRSLEISQNSLARINNMVVGTYINMGVQSVALIASLPTLMNTVKGLTVAMTGLQLSTGGIGIALMAIAGIAGIATLAWNDHEKAVKSTSQSYTYLEQDINNFYELQQKWKEEVYILSYGME